MLMPFERMRVGISSDSASHTQTPGPMAKKAMNTNRATATSHPLCALGTGLISAFSILSGAICDLLRFPNGFEKNALTVLPGIHSSRLIWTGFAAGSSERTAGVAERKSPQE